MKMSSIIGFGQSGLVSNTIAITKFPVSKLKPRPASFSFKSLLPFAIILLVLSLSACGGGGGGGTPADPGDTTAPDAPVISSPANGSQTFNRSPNVTGTAEADSTVVLFDTNGTTSLGSTTTNASGNWNMTSSSLGTGAHSLTAKATDAASNTSTASTAVSVTILAIPTVGSLYPGNGANWNDYVQALDTVAACDGTETGGYLACIHGGEKRAVEVPGYSSCTGLTATDALGAFDWSCDVSTNPVRMVSTGLRDITAITGTTDSTATDQLVNSTASFVTDGIEAGDTVINTTDYTTTTVVSIDSETQLTLTDDTFVSGESYSINRDKNLSDLLNFGAPGWKNNSVTVLDGATTFFSTASSIWWSNPIVIDNDGGSLADVGADGIGEIYLVTIDPNADYELASSKIALVVKPGGTLTGSGLGLSVNVIFTANTPNFLWLEGMIDATSENRGIYLTSVKFSVIRNLSASNASNSGVRLSNSSNNSLSNITVTNNNFGVQLQGSLNNTLSNITAANNRNYGVIFWSSSNNNNLSNITTNNNGGYGVYLGGSGGSSNNTLLNITASNSDIGVYLDGSSNNSLSNITVSNNNTAGVWLDGVSDNNSLSNIIATNSIDGDGVYLQSSSNNSLSNITVTNNLWEGVFLSNSSNNNTLSNITATNNTDNGVYLSGSTDNSLSNITAANNGNIGIALQSSSDNSLSNITTVNNLLYGILLQFASNNSLSNVSAANNGNNGVRIANSADNSLLNVASAHNGNYGVALATATNTYISGLLKVGRNPLGDCIDNGGTTFSDVDCTAVAPSDFTLTQGVTLASSFIGKIMTDDILNTSDTSGGASYPADPAIFDWTSFDNNYRGWGKDAAFPGSASRGLWTTGMGHIWDWSLALYDDGDPGPDGNPGGGDDIPAIESVLVIYLTGDAANTITHNWTSGSTTYLRNASEIMGTGGNDNGLCETDETCLFTPNIGSYQGHGILQSAGDFTGGDTITGVILVGYPDNGYE